MLDVICMVDNVEEKPCAKNVVFDRAVLIYRFNVVLKLLFLFY